MGQAGFYGLVDGLLALGWRGRGSVAGNGAGIPHIGQGYGFSAFNKVGFVVASGGGLGVAGNGVVGGGGAAWGAGSDAVVVQPHPGAFGWDLLGHREVDAEVFNGHRVFVGDGAPQDFDDVVGQLPAADKAHGDAVAQGGGGAGAFNIPADLNFGGIVDGFPVVVGGAVGYAHIGFAGVLLIPFFCA